MDDFTRVESIFLAALKKEPAEERTAYLDEACGQDAELRAQVVRLLEAHPQAGSFMEYPAQSASEAATLPPSPIAEGPGSVIAGRYKLLQQIGEGGMGVVYLAEQTEPMRRKVALKIIKPGMDSQQVIARFEAERQALAMMDHQNIAKVLDAGTVDNVAHSLREPSASVPASGPVDISAAASAEESADGTRSVPASWGRPYFVMELVKGVPITEYCDRNKLSPRERLELFIPVCQAIQHAHQKGIIHRDVKPSNALVCLYDGKPVPKVIDFGVAKAIDQRLTERTMFTQHGQIVGTLEYMSPEQAEFNQLDVDTRSDIYSLGVLLYELLTGSTPIPKEKLREAAFVEILRSICEDEPERPSTRLSHSGDALPAISEKRRTDPKKLGTLLRGELDWIVMKSLDKDRTRRYATAGDFAKDIQRHLENEPVEACPPSAMYKFRKFAHRHRAALLTTTAFLIVLVLGVVISVSQAVRASKMEQFAVEGWRAELKSRRAAEKATQAEAAARQTAESLADQRDAESRRARDAEQKAKADRDRAVAAEQQAHAEREKARDSLCRSLFEQARAVRLAGQPGRRWQILDLVKQAEELRAEHAQRTPAAAGADSRGEPLPARFELASEAVAGLMLRDGRVVGESAGVTHGLSPDGRFAAAMWIDPDRETGGVRLVDLVADKELLNVEGKEQAKPIAGTAMAVAPDGKRLASVAIDFRGVVLAELPSGKRLRQLKLPAALEQSTESALHRAFEAGAEAYRRAKRQPPPAKAAPKADATSSAPAPAASSARAASQPAARPGTTKAAGRGPVTVESAFPFAMLRSVAFSPNGRFLAGVQSGATKGHIVVWDLEGESAEGRLVGTANVSTPVVSFSPDSRLLAYAAGGRKVVLWNLETASIEDEIELQVALAGPPLAFFPDGRHLAIYAMEGDSASAGDLHGVIVRWDMQAGRVVERTDTRLSVSMSQLAISGDGRRIAVGDMRGFVEVIEFGSGGETHSLTLEHGAIVQQLLWQPNGRLVSAGLGSLKVWELADEPPVAALRLSPGETGKMRKLAFSPDGRWVAAEKAGGPDVWLFDRASGSLLRTFQHDDRGSFLPFALEFSPDSRLLVHLGMGGMMAWDVQSGQPQGRLQTDLRQGDLAWSVGFTADGKPLVGGIAHNTPTVWDGMSGSPLWQGKKSPACLAVVSRDGRLAVTYPSMFMGKTAAITVRRMPGGEQTFQVEQPRRFGLQMQASFSPQSRWLAAFELLGMGRFSPADMPQGGMALVPSNMPGKSGWTATVWDAATGNKQLDLSGPANVEQYAFSPNDHFLALALRDGSVQLWDITERRHLFDWQAWPRDAASGTPTGKSRYLSFTPDGKTLAILDSESDRLELLELSQLNNQLVTAGLEWTKETNR